MQLQVTFRHIEPSESLKIYAQDKIGKIKKFLDGNLEANVTLSVEKHRQVADVTIIADGIKIHGREVTGDLYSALDIVADKLETQVKRYRDRLLKAKRNARRDRELAMKVDVFAAQSLEAEESEPKIVKSKNIVASPMAISEAAMHLDLMDGGFFVFINAQNEELNIIYRRPQDGDYGLVELKQ
ncbi:MAG: ribosome-associated translation inhibitor RaiA [Desulfarculales bacterium]|jgi:putative sigma-54 modulation protein|nr:ribosome-associated translation inhibitor RaiA [Desulfarculales bacterium]